MILCALHRVFGDVAADSVERTFVADNVFVIIALPHRSAGRSTMSVDASRSIRSSIPFACHLSPRKDGKLSSPSRRFLALKGRSLEWIALSHGTPPTQPFERLRRSSDERHMQPVRSARVSERFANVAPCGYIQSMKTVGIRDLRNRLSHYIRLVKRGEALQVTDRGTVVAELCPPGEGHIDRTNPAVDALLRRGGATIGRPNRPDLYGRQRSIVKPGTAQRLIDAERGNR